MTEDINEPGRATAASPKTTERVAERAHEAVDKAAAHLSEQEIRLREGAAHAEAQARDKAERLRSAAGAGETEVVEYVREHPLKSLAIAFAAGYVIAALRR